MSRRDRAPVLMQRRVGPMSGFQLPGGPLVGGVPPAKNAGTAVLLHPPSHFSRRFNRA